MQKLKYSATMEQYPEGLNYLPLLTHGVVSPSRIRVTNKGSQHFGNYNGNYEGDTTMFKARGLDLERFDSCDTDSDTEYKKDLEKYVSTTSMLAKPKESLLRRLFFLYMLRFLSPEMVLKITQLGEEFVKSRLYHRLRVCTNCITVLCLRLFHLISFFWYKIGYLSYGLWKSLSMFRNLARRLLWCMTLAKGGDLCFFALILFGTPWLFAIATFGFIISLYCCLKECLQRMVYFIKTRII